MYSIRIYTYFYAYCIYISVFFTKKPKHTLIWQLHQVMVLDNFEKEAKPGDDYCLLLCGASPPCRSWEAAPMGLLKVLL